MDAPSKLSWIGPFLLLLWLHANASFGQNDPVKNFCRRWGHQSAVVDRRLYIDGGLINYGGAATNNQTNTFFSYNDLDAVSSGGMPPFYANLSKNDTIPSVNGGMLWEDSINKRLYLYGGEYQGGSPQPFNFYSYDILYDEWLSFGSPPPEVQAASYGAGVSIPSRGEAYFYGGWLSNASVQGWSGPPAASNGLIKYEMDSNTWSNDTGPDDTGRAEGTMVYLPVGDGGMLVYFGGAQDLYGNGTLTPQPLDEIFLYDVANAKWYTQKTSGNTPGNRRRFCGGATWAKDHSSYNIYIYGGGGFEPDTIGFDDIYILTIPSFQWIRGPYPTYRNGTGSYPKSMMSCNVIDNAQMLVIGGTYSNATQKVCDVPAIQGAHNMNLGKQNKEDAIWALYQPSLTTYIVPMDIRTAVGGSSTGGATKTTPVSGFDAPDLAVQMERTAASGTRTATRATETSTKKAAPATHTSKPSSGLDTGAIAGIAVGSAVAFMLALAGCGLLIYRRRKHYSQSHGVAAPPPRNDMTMTGPPVAGGWDVHNQVSPLAGTAPSYGGGHTWPAHPPSELTSETRSPDMHSRMSPKNEFHVAHSAEGFIAFENTTVVPTLLSSAHGKVLELGPGPGNQIQRFDQSKVDFIYAIEPNANYEHTLTSKVEKHGLTEKYKLVTCGLEDSDILRREGITEGCMDTVLSIQVLCAVEDAKSAAKEAYNLLKPGGCFIFWEHEKSKDTLMGLIQACLNPLWAGFIGCCVTRDIKSAILAAGEWENPKDIKQPQDAYNFLPRVWGVLIKK
ncbi:hypothetical protein FMEXI_14395 [Fusarium mexicanum]|uniref:Methyltransferase type 11 domain-containing protein n=1 Tax=Fusarium mexicanum TaxID=751941 RepID=A0A8H5I775_9HYPO|nr:hypothetical protein FMEXI_14395 [Fusarium mexicanum]